MPARNGACLHHARLHRRHPRLCQRGRGTRRVALRPLRAPTAGLAPPSFCSLICVVRFVLETDVDLPQRAVCVCIGIGVGIGIAAPAALARPLP